jgi:hypothetical protein
MRAAKAGLLAVVFRRVELAGVYIGLLERERDRGQVVIQ